MKEGNRRAVTIAEVATDAGVSVPTVSRVLNSSAPVAPSTRHRVLTSIERLGYRPNPMARGLSRGHSDTVMVILPHIAEPSVMLRLQGLIGVLRDSPYELHLVDIEHPATERPRSLADIVLAHRPAAVVIVSLPPSPEDEAQLLESGTPAVLIDATSAALPGDTIDDVEGGAMAVRHLLDLGHRRVGFVGDDERATVGVPASAARRLGYERALAADGIPVRPEYIHTGADGTSTATDLGMALLSLPEPPTAVFAAYDVRAFGVLAAARWLGLDVPGDVSVVGFDDIQAAAWAGLSTVRQPLETSGRRAGLRVLAALGHETTQPLPELPALQLIARGTTGPVSTRQVSLRSPVAGSNGAVLGEEKPVSTDLDPAPRRGEEIPRRKRHTCES